MTLEEWQIALRVQAATKEHFSIKEIPNSFGEFLVKSDGSKNQYKVVYRGKDSEWNYCSCMDFKTSQLGTCKHLEAVRMTKPAVVLELPPYSSVFVSYRGPKRRICLRLGYDNREEISALASAYFDSEGILRDDAYLSFDTFVNDSKEQNLPVKIYQDAIDYIVAERGRIIREKLITEKYSDSELDKVIHATLYPYQKEGVRFAFRNGKSIIADEMGLGKTIQTICTAEIMRKEGLIQNALIVCPTSLKYQWKREIEKFTDAEVHVIEGNHLKRLEQYALTDKSYKIISYNSICNDIKILGEIEVELLIMDEVQRLKNWKTQIAKGVRKIKSQYSVILSGTPLENKLDDLYSIVQLADQYCLGPYYKFRSEHIMTTDAGKVIGYQNLNAIKADLDNILIRRKKSEVKLQLPGRQDKNLIIPITPKQMGMHNEYQTSVAQIVAKWQRFKFLSESDRLRLMMLLTSMRMVCDSTFLIDQKTRYDTKVEELINIVCEIVDTTDEKVVIFSQWERMTRLIASELDSYDIGYEYLHGGVPSVKRKALIDNFTDDPSKRVFISTDAGGVGLNLQVASVVINVDLPWNPGVLEQRIARIWRIGQQNNIQVINLVAQGTIEQNMIGRLRFKSAMAEGVLDGGDDSIFLDDEKFNSIVETIGSMITENSESEPAQVVQEDDREENIPEIIKEVAEEAPEEEVSEEELRYSGENIRKEFQENRETVEKSMEFMSKMESLLSSKAVCNMLIGALSMEDPEHIQDHIAMLSEGKENIGKMLEMFKKFSEK